MRYILEIRSQHSTGSSSHKFGGPDTYVAVQCVPEGVETLTRLAKKTAAKQGIEILYFGEGYSVHRGPKSALGRAIKEARDFITSKQAMAKKHERVRYMSTPHGRCELAGYCVEHEANLGGVEACR